MSANAMKRVQSILAVNSEEHIAKACQTILDKLPKSQFDVYLIAAAFPIIRENSMNTVLMQEIMRFNKLYNLIVKSIDQILQAQSGDILMTDELATAAEQIFKG
jgi:dynein heavy chain